MSRTYYHRHHKRMHKPPRRFTNAMVRAPERRQTRDMLKKLPIDLEDTPEFPKGSKPNADWDWS